MLSPKPMIPFSAAPADRPAYLHEQKWDGMRTFAVVDGGFSLQTKTGRRHRGDAWPELAGLATLPDVTALDGELVIFDTAGRAEPGAVLSRASRTCSVLQTQLLARLRPAVLMVFDLLWIGGRDLTGWPIEDRKSKLHDVLALAASPSIREVEWVTGQGLIAYRLAEQLEIEGVVAKAMGSRYVQGRSRSWLKIKTPGYQPKSILGPVVGAGTADVRLT